MTIIPISTRTSNSLCGVSRRACVLWCGALMVLGGMAHGQPVTPAENFSYTSDGSSITITGYTGAALEVYIPATIATLPVTRIGDEAFLGKPLTHVEIPAGVTSIGSMAFQETMISSMTLPSGLITLGDFVFAQCSSLGGLTIPNSVTTMGMGLFSACPSLSSVVIGSGVTVIPAYMFNLCTVLPSVVIPNSVTTIGDRAFNACVGLTSVVIGNQVTSIGMHAFYHCTQLVGVSLPASVTSIGEQAFRDCANLTTITIPASVTSIGDYAFQACNSLASVTIQGSLTSCGEGAFYACSQLKVAAFMGDAPWVMGPYGFDGAATTFKVGFMDGKNGFSTPFWMGYPSSIMLIEYWLLEHGLPIESDLLSDPNGDGVSLLMAYALDLDPNLDLSNSMPKPVSSGNQMSLTFYAASPGVTYTVQSSVNLADWGTQGVTITHPDATHLTGAIPTSAPKRFMRIAAVYEIPPASDL